MSNQAEAMMQGQIEGAISENEALRREVDRLRASVGVVVRAAVRAAVHHAVEACAAATGQHRVIAHFVNKTHIANEVLAAVSSVAADQGPNVRANLPP